MENSTNGNSNLSDNYTNGTETNDQQNGNRSNIFMNPARLSLPGILHFLQYEWKRFECERQQWCHERAELVAQLGMLKGELMAHINIKNDLVRRIKMLEYCIKNERVKYHKLKYGEDVPILETNDDSNNEEQIEEENNINTDDLLNGGKWKYGRELLREYLQEVGYTETIINVRSTRVRSLLGLSDNNVLNENNQNVNNTDSAQSASNQEYPGGLEIQTAPETASVNSKQGILQQMNRQNRKLNEKSNPNSEIVNDSEASVMNVFDFLDKGSYSYGSDGFKNRETEEEAACAFNGEAMDSETEEVLAEFDFLSAHQTNNFSSNSNNQALNSKASGSSTVGTDTKDGAASNSHKNMNIVDIGELAGISLNDDFENETNKTAETQAVSYRKTWNPRYLLKSHFDCVRSLRFHPTLPILITVSDDETIKVWDLNRLPQTSAKARQAVTGMTIDLEPVYTYRGHTSAVLSLTLVNNTIYSGSRNGELLIWRLPDCSNIDQYDPYDPSLAIGQLTGHTDAIWSVVSMNYCDVDSKQNAPTYWICSASADRSIRVWDSSTNECIKTITWENLDASPTCLAPFPITHEEVHNYKPTQSPKFLAASFTDGTINIYDLNNTDYAKPVLTFDSSKSRVNAIVIHQLQPVIASAHEDRYIKFWDFSTGECFHTMVAHLDEVSCLDCDLSGQYLLSGSHDCSVRLWNFSAKTCIQEITSHRKKFDEAIFDVTFHPNDTMFASAGAESLAKVFV